MNEDELLDNAQWVHRLARRLLRDVNMAEDVAQDVMIIALEQRQRLPSPVRWRAWLSSVTRNLAFQALRREGLRSHVEQTAARTEATHSSGARTDLHLSLTKAVLELEEDQRTVLMMRFYEDMPPREIARRLGLPGPTVRKRLSRALAQLRAIVSGRSDFDERRWLASLAIASRSEPAGPSKPTTLWPYALVAGLATGATFVTTLSSPAPTEDAAPTSRSLPTPRPPYITAVRMTAPNGRPIWDVPLCRWTENGIESLGRTNGNGMFEFSGPSNNIFVVAPDAPPQLVDLTHLPTTSAARENAPLSVVMDFGRIFLGTVSVNGERPTDPLLFRLYVDAEDAGAERVPPELLESEFVTLTPEGDYELRASTGSRDSFFFWGIPSRTEVLLESPAGMRFDTHPPGTLFPDGMALELTPPPDVEAFGLIPNGESNWRDAMQSIVK